MEACKAFSRLEMEVKAAADLSRISMLLSCCPAAVSVLLQCGSERSCTDFTFIRP